MKTKYDFGNSILCSSVLKIKTTLTHIEYDLTVLFT